MVEAGLFPASIFYTNVFRSYPPSGKLEEWLTFKPKVAAKNGFIPRGSAYVHPTVASHIDDLEREIAAVRPNIMILAGNAALWAVLGEWGISNWRGSLLPEPRFGIKCLPTFNPAYLFQSWEQRPLMVWDYKKVAREQHSGALPVRQTNFILRPSATDAIAWLDALRARCDTGPTWFSPDIETKHNEIDCIGIATSETDAICIPFFSAEYPLGCHSEEEEALIVHALSLLLAHPNARPIWHNGMFDANYIAKQWGIAAPVAMDTMIQWHTIFTGLEKSLAFVSSIILPYHRYWKDEGKTWSVSDMEKRWAYCCKDCCATFEIKEALDKLGAALGLTKQIDEEMSYFPIFFDMGLRGVRQTKEGRTAAGKELRPQIKERMKAIEFIFDHPVNVKSNKQMKALFYGDLGIPPITHRKTHEPTLAADALEKIAQREPVLRYPIMLIEQIRSMGVYDSTFIRATLDDDSRLRTSYNLAGTDTLRLSSSKTPFGTGANLQNLPKGSQIKIAKLVKENGKLSVDEIASGLGMEVGVVEDNVDDLLDKAVLTKVGRNEKGYDVVSALFVLPNIRSFFLADEGYGWLEPDLDRADAQIVAWEADDPILKEIFRKGLDLHTENIKAMGLRDSSTHSARDLAKKGIHSVDYKVGARTLASHLGITVREAEDFIARWFSIHPSIPAWHRRTATRLGEKKLENRYVESAFGFRRYYFDRPEASLTKALAWVPQHTVAIAINRGIRNLYHSTLPIQLLLQVHDSAPLQVIKNGLTFVERKGKTYETSGLFNTIRNHLLIPIPYPDPLTIPISLTYSPTDWGSVSPVIAEENGKET